MADLDFKTPAEVADEYLTTLKAAKPEINRDQQDSDWWVRGQVIGGVVSGAYADIRKVSTDCFPQSARRDALEQHLITKFGTGFTQPTRAQGPIRFGGTAGQSLPADTEFLHVSSGNLYRSVAEVLLDAATGTAVIRSVSTGQQQNLLAGTALVISAPPPGIDPSAVTTDFITDGRDEETKESAAARILADDRDPPAGGKATDFKAWALAADPAVVDVNVLRFPFGLGTVGLVIQAGTTDIDAAVDAGLPVVVTPSPELRARVKTYVDAVKPLTATVYTFAPQELPVDVEVLVAFLSGTAATIPAGQTMNQGDLVRREVRRALYKMPPGGRLIDGVGYVKASEIDEVIGIGIAGTDYVVGRLQLVGDHRVADLAATGANLMILGTQKPIPGVITVTEI